MRAGNGIDRLNHQPTDAPLPQYKGSDAKLSSPRSVLVGGFPSACWWRDRGVYVLWYSLATARLSHRHAVAPGLTLTVVLWHSLPR